MSDFGVILLAAALLGLMVIGYVLVEDRARAKESRRRLEAVRFRHSESAKDRVEAQLKKAIAARRPNRNTVAGPTSHLEALALRLERTGKTWTVRQYLLGSLTIALVVAALVYVRSGAGLLALAVGVLAGAGLPHMVVNRLISRRLNGFTIRLPDALELLVRGLRSGLPVGETFKVIASEIPGPVGEEFKTVVERMKIGQSMEDALQSTADKLAMAEFQFFVISLAIQRETGGNLAETLSNLADVLRKRAQMKLKIRAMSSESKASAYIVGVLPFLVFGMIWWINPDYIGGFFEEERLIIAGLGGLVWMSIGAFVMAKMVSFEI
jgi:tight adherence protein B